MNLAPLLNQLESAQLVRRTNNLESNYTFKHVLTQEAAYSSLLFGERKHLHRIVAQVLEQQYADHLDQIAAQLANHFQLAEEFYPSFKYFILAGDAATRVYANAEAHAQYEHAFRILANLPAADERIRHEADTLIKLVSVSTIIDTPENNLAWLAHADTLVQRLKKSHPSDQQRLGQIYFWRGFLNMIRGELELSNTAYRRTIDLVTDYDDLKLIANALFDMGINLNFQGQFSRSASQMTLAIQLLEKSGKPLEDISALAHLGYALVAQGQFADGIEKIKIGLTSAQSSENPFGMATCLTVLALAYHLENDAVKMLETAEKVVHIAEKFGTAYWALAGHTLGAWATSRLERHELAQTHLAKAKTLSRQFDMPLFGGGLLNAIEAEVALNAGHIDEALLAVEKTIAAAQPVGGILAQAMAERVWAQSLAKSHPANFADIEMHLHASLQLLEAGNAQLEAAHTHVVWGTLVRARGNENSACAHFTLAATQFEHAGLARELDKTRALLMIGK